MSHVTLLVNVKLWKEEERRKWVRQHAKKGANSCEVYSCPLHAKIMARIMFSLPLVSLYCAVCSM